MMFTVVIFSWLAVFVLPLNAVADPFLYTLRHLKRKEEKPTAVHQRIMQR